MTECDKIVPLEVNARIRIVDVSYVVITVPVDHDAVLHSELKTAERNRNTSVCNEVPINTQFNVYSVDWRGATEVFAQDCDASASAPRRYC